jgi:ParB-like chromosome segregation protein Spo0J
MPPLTDEEYQALKDDIAERGVIIPIEIDEDGNILDGHHRLKAWDELNSNGATLPDYPRVVRGGLTEEQKRNHVRALNIIRRQLNKEQRQQIWAEMRKDGATYREIAEATGVDRSTVSKSLGENSQTHTDESYNQPSHVIGKDGKIYPPKKKRKKKEKLPQAPPVSIYANSDNGEEKAKAKAQKIAETGSEGATQQVQVTIFSSESNEYYTPPKYLEAAHEVMGRIDLDPASCEAAQENVRAKNFYTVADDGLNQEWHGSVWLNPPYGTTGSESNQGIWANKLIEEYKAGRTTEAILLTKAALGYNWFEDLWYDWPVCFARERLSFIKVDGSTDGQSKQGTALFYFGPDVEKFKRIFRRFGRIIMPEAEDGTL